MPQIRRKMTTLRRDGSVWRPKVGEEVMLVVNTQDTEPARPTIFVSARCLNREDKRWFDEVLNLLTLTEVPV
jgi:hypothetical protein